MASTPAVMATRGASVVAVRGADTWSYLQSLVSQDLEPLADGQGARSLLLQPQGRLVAAFRVLRAGPEDAVLDAAPGVAEPLVEALARFRIRVAVEFEDRTGAWDVLAVRGEGADAAVGRALGADVPTAQHAFVAVDDGFLVRADWPAAPGVDLIGSVASIERARPQLESAGVVADADAIDALRVASGVPVQGLDVDDRTIPQEAFLERDGVSFTKGCFVGQELVCRIDTRGSKVPRYLRHVEIDGDRVPDAGAQVLVDGTARGVVTSAARVSGRTLALAMVQRTVEPPAGAEVVWGDTAARATVRAIPTD